ncbi:hypothetical protein M231_03425 [Tremella mesenterica]|uniref:Uncharacterized protein n=1 Tax=Tremella mesenterica TaxID=5217 RepID=A0A4Q1BNB7_TREME|nr:hypothetical protein M231_03425 [Tremella mesenterica]
MGADGGSIPDRRDLVKTKASAAQTDKAVLREQFFLCSLSKRPLSRPVVLDPLGRLYNKDAILEYFIDKTKYGDGDKICGYLKSLKDLLTLNLSPNPAYAPQESITTALTSARAPFVCPLSMKEMTGSVPFIALRPCGCVFSDASIRAVIPTLSRGIAAKTPSNDNSNEDKSQVTCPNCGASFNPTSPTSILPINPTPEVREVLLEHLLQSRAAAKAAKGKKRKAGDVMNGDDTRLKVTKVDDKGSVSPTPGPEMGRQGTRGAPPVPRSVQDKLAEQEKKRLIQQAGMSDAVKSMFKPKEVAGEKKNGAAEFFGRTFTRYAA